jgi:hypothetical protein
MQTQTNQDNPENIIHNIRHLSKKSNPSHKASQMAAVASRTCSSENQDGEVIAMRSNCIGIIMRGQQHMSKQQTWPHAQH